MRFCTLTLLAILATGSVAQTSPPNDTQNTRLLIKEIRLAFDDDRTTLVAARNQRLQAVAYINFVNSGLFNAVWEIATPASTRGQVVFRPLQYIRRYLSAGGRAIIHSPPLPTTEKGLYLLRLVYPPIPAEPVVSVIQYAIGEHPVDSQTKMANMRLLTPAPKIVLTRQTRFRWQAVPNAQAYQLELYNHSTIDAPTTITKSTATYISENKNSAPTLQKPTLQKKSRPSSGLLVPGSKTELELSPLSWQHLATGEVYYWRVIAISSNGKILAKSSLRNLRTP